MGAISERSTLSLSLILSIAVLVVGIVTGAIAYVISGARESGEISAKLDRLTTDVQELRTDVNTLRTMVMTNTAKLEALGK